MVTVAWFFVGLFIGGAFGIFVGIFLAFRHAESERFGRSISERYSERVQ